MPARLIALTIFLHAAAATAGTVTVTIEPTQGQDFANQMGSTIAALEQQIASELETAYNVLEPGEYLQSLTDAQAFSTKGLGVDYASNPTGFVVGLSGNFALSLGDEGLGERYEDRPVLGAAPNASLMAGLNLGLFGFDSLTVYANYFAHRDTVKGIDVSLNNFGLHAQLKFFRPEGDGMELVVQWGGFDITTGLEYARMSAEAGKDLESDFPLSGDQATVDARYVGTGTFTITSDSRTIPLELSTNLRILYFVTLFGGLGIDWQLDGGGDMTVDLDGELQADDPRGGADPITLGNARVTVEDSADPSAAKLRFLAGLQLNLWMFKVFTQVNVIPDGAISAGAGVRLVW